MGPRRQGWAGRYWIVNRVVNLQMDPERGCPEERSGEVSCDRCWRAAQRGGIRRGDGWVLVEREVRPTEQVKARLQDHQVAEM